MGVKSGIRKSNRLWTRLEELAVVRISVWTLLLALGFAMGAAMGASAPARATEVVKARAVTVPSHDLEVVSPVGGVIQRMLVKEGDRVTKGQPLVELHAEVQKASLAIAEYNAKSTASLEAAEANLRVKRADYKRQKTLHGKGVGSDADLEKAEFEMKYSESLLTVEKEKLVLGQLKVKLERANVERMTIRAPLAAIVTSRIQDVGEAAEEYRPVLKLVVLDTLDVIAHVPSQAALRLRPGMAAQLVVDNLPDVRHACRVAMVDPVVDAASDTCRTKLELPNPDHKVAAGSRCTVYFDLTAAPKAPAKPPKKPR